MYHIFFISLYIKYLLYSKLITYVKQFERNILIVVVVMIFIKKV